MKHEMVAPSEWRKREEVSPRIMLDPTGPDFERHGHLINIPVSPCSLTEAEMGIAAITEVHGDGCNPTNYLEPDRQAKPPIRQPWK